MKKLLLMSVCALAVLLVVMTACSKERDDVNTNVPQQEKPGDTPNDPSDNDFYYVKYEVKYSHQQTVEHSVNVNTEVGQQKISLGMKRSGTWEGTYGPFKKGFVASISFAGATISGELRINVSKNNEMFVLKKHKTSDRGLGLGSISYLIQ